MQLGGGWTGLTAKTASTNMEYTGGGGSLAIALGVSLSSHLALYFEFLDAGSADPDIKVNGTSVGAQSGDSDVLGVGAGLAYYFVPMNWFVAATLMTTKVEISDSSANVIRESKWGVGLEALFGKEWWVSDNWGLGVSGQLVLASMKGKDLIGFDTEVPAWTAASFALLFSATYN